MIAILFTCTNTLNSAGTVRESADLILTEEQKAKVGDYVEAAEATSSKLQNGLKKINKGLEQLNNNYQHLDKKSQQLIDLGNRTLKKQVNNTLNIAKGFDAGLKKAKSAKEKLDNILGLYDRFRPQPDNPYRSLEVIINLLEQAESLLPDEIFLEQVRNPPVFLIRTGINYFKEAVKAALEGAQKIQNLLRNRAGNCIGNVNGDNSGDSPIRMQYFNIDKTGDQICYTGIRPKNGEIWSNTLGDNVYLWDTKKEKLTHLNCSLGDAQDIFDLWNLAHKNAISANMMKHWCNNELDVFKKEKKKAQERFSKLLLPTSCQKDILRATKEEINLKMFMDSLGRDRDTFVSKYIFQQENVRNTADSIYKRITQNILFEGYVTSTKGKPISSASVYIKAGSTDGNTNAKYDNFFRILAKVPSSEHRGLPIKLKITANGYTEYHETWKLQEQCNGVNITLTSLKQSTSVSSNIPTTNECLGIKNSIKAISNEVKTKNSDLMRLRSKIASLQQFSHAKARQNHMKVEGLTEEIASISTLIADLSKEICQQANSLKSSNISQNKKQKNYNWIKANQNKLKALLTSANSLYKSIGKYKREIGVLAQDINNLNRELINYHELLNIIDIDTLFTKLDSIETSNCPKEITAQKNKTLSDISKLKNVFRNVTRTISNKQKNFKQIKQAYSDIEYLESLAKVYLDRVYKAANYGATCAVKAEDIMQKIERSDANLFDNQDMCKKWPGSQYRINPDTGKPSCYCVGQTVWNLNKTKCVSKKEFAMENANCTIYPGSIKVWSNTNNRVECTCPQDSQWNVGRTACIRKNPIDIAMANANCDRYPRSTKVWNSSKNRVECACQGDLIWNVSKTACIKRNPVVVQPNIDKKKKRTGTKCPKTHTGRGQATTLYNDDVTVTCKYFRDRSLQSQVPRNKKGQKHGLQLVYQSKQPHRLHSKITFKNGKEHGTNYWWATDSKTGKYYLNLQRTMKDGKTNGTSSTYYSNGNLNRQSKFRNGKVYESRTYNYQKKNGQLVTCTRYSPSGKKTSCMPKR